MTKTQEALMREFTSEIGEQYRDIYWEIAQHAISLGYTPSRCKTQKLTIDFKNSKLKKKIMKIETLEQSHDGFKYGERNVPGLRLKFFAEKEYSEPFQLGVKRVIEGFDGRYTGCYGCGRCAGKPQGYRYVYPDGKTVFRCGSELISVFGFEDRVDEVKRLLTRQAEYFEQMAQP